jgi:hypothetical protein
MGEPAVGLPASRSFRMVRAASWLSIRVVLADRLALRVVLDPVDAEKVFTSEQSVIPFLKKLRTFLESL